MHLLLANPPRRTKARKPKRKLSAAARAALIDRLNKGRRKAGLAPVAGGTTGRTAANARLSRRSSRSARAGRRRPARSTARRRRRRTVAVATNPPQKGSTMARRSRRSSRRSSRRRGGSGRSARGFAIPGGLTAVAGSVAGFTAAQILPNYVPVAALKTGYGRIGAQAAAGVLTYALLRKSYPTLAAALGGGMLTAAGVGLVAQFMQGRQGGSNPPAQLPPPAESLRGIGDVDAVRYAGLGDLDANTYG